MSTIKDGGPAFPAAGMTGRGLTMRDYFAAKAIASVMAPNPVTGQCALVSDFEACAETAYKMADAMLKAREGGAA